jgi:hypothetical protein
MAKVLFLSIVRGIFDINDILGGCSTPFLRWLVVIIILADAYCVVSWDRNQGPFTQYASPGGLEVSLLIWK